MGNTIEMVFETFDEAMDVHKKLYSLMRENKVVTCTDLYVLYREYAKKIPIALSFDEVDNFSKYGWKSLWGSKVEPNINDVCWVLKMPDIEKIR